MPEPLDVRISVSGPDGLELIGAEKPIATHSGGVTPAIVFVKIPKKNLTKEQEPIVFHAEATRSTGQSVETRRESVFIGPRK
jgi:uncharacterized protein (UPF0261 family)